MDRYFENERLNVQTSIDSSQFGDLEFMDVYNLLEQTKEYPLWDVATGGTIWGIPIVIDGIVYFGATDHILYAVDVDGKEVWRFQTNGLVNLITPPAYADGIIYATSYDHNLYAVDAKTGVLVWKFSTQDKMVVEPLVVDGKVYVGSRDKKLYCLDAKTGKKEWEFATQGPISSSANFYNGKIYFGSWDGNLYSINRGGRLLWKFPTKDLIAKKPAISEGTVFAVSRDGNLYAVDAESGKEKWRYRTQNGLPTSEPKVFGDLLCFTSTFEKTLIVLRAKDGKILWKLKTNNLQYGHAVIHENAMIFSGNDGTLYSLDKKTGRVIWKFTEKIKADLADGCAIWKDRIFVGSRNCKLLCISLEGTLLWEFKTTISFPSTIEPEAFKRIEKMQLTLTREAEKEEDRYKQQFIQDETGFQSQYVVKSKYVVESKYTKGRKIKSMSSGWED